jgi:hypothetical protein
VGQRAVVSDAMLAPGARVAAGAAVSGPVAGPPSRADGQV